MSARAAEQAGNPPPNLQLSLVDPGAMLTLPPPKDAAKSMRKGGALGAGGAKVAEEGGGAPTTISGQIQQGKIPSTRGKPPPINNSNK